MGNIVTPEGAPATAPNAHDRLLPLFDWLQANPHPSAFQRVIVNGIIGVVQMVGTLTRQYVEHRHGEDGAVVLPANVLMEAAKMSQAGDTADAAPVAEVAP